ncbi:hypothetical protein BY458DRAFT_477660 [Sporodiniella umbellata]|nr:hypothetical protein BY458DRAFT_477660 [Sporodiniella umbellata]
MDSSVQHISLEKLATAAKRKFKADITEAGRALIMRRNKSEEKRKKRLLMKFKKAADTADGLQQSHYKKKYLKDTAVTNIKLKKLPQNMTCTECGCRLNGATNSNLFFYPVLSPKSPCLASPVCTGCERFFSSVTTTEEKDALIHWTVTGELNPGVEVKFLRSNQRFLALEALSEKLIVSADDMTSILKDPYPEVARQEEIRKLYIEKDGKDMVLGHPVLFPESFQKTDGEHFSCIRLDFINPIWTFPNENDYFKINNVQITSKAIANVKKTSEQKVVDEWLNLFLKNKRRLPK